MLEIARLVQMLDRVVSALPPAGPGRHTSRELQRLLYSLEAITRPHFAQEEVIYKSLA